MGRKEGKRVKERGRMEGHEEKMEQGSKGPREPRKKGETKEGRKDERQERRLKRWEEGRRGGKGGRWMGKTLQTLKHRKLLIRELFILQEQFKCNFKPLQNSF